MNSHNAVLYVDDDEDDRVLLTEAIREMAPALKVVEAENGVKALEYLKDAKNNLPCLVVLDINMPFMDGKQTLERIKADQDLSHLDVVIFTSSENPNDKMFFKNKGVNLVVKPFDNKTLKQIVKQFIDARYIK
jgi:CheY-like chemotaxis protein